MLHVGAIPHVHCALAPSEAPASPAAACLPPPPCLAVLPQKAAFAGDPVRLRAALTAEERALEMLAKLRGQVGAPPPHPTPFCTT